MLLKEKFGIASNNQKYTKDSPIFVSIHIQGVIKKDPNFETK